MQIWKQAIGEFMVNFNECEYWVYACIAQLIRPKLAAVVSDGPLKQRSKCAKAALLDAKLPIPPEQIESVFTRLASMADFRNILAHNAPMVAVYEYQRAGNIEPELEVVIELANRKGETTPLARIREQAEAARALSESMCELFKQIVQASTERPVDHGRGGVTQ